jgi:2-isopropylmalate synthase
VIQYTDERKELTGEGTGTLAAFVHGIRNTGGPLFEVVSYHEHALSTGTAASAIAYVQLQFEDGRRCWGAAEDPSIGRAGIKAVLSAMNRYGTQ